MAESPVVLVNTDIRGLNLSKGGAHGETKPQTATYDIDKRYTVVCRAVNGESNRRGRVWRAKFCLAGRTRERQLRVGIGKRL